MTGANVAAFAPAGLGEFPVGAGTSTVGDDLEKCRTSGKIRARRVMCDTGMMSALCPA
jgi:hypothetical protein